MREMASGTKGRVIPEFTGELSEPVTVQQKAWMNSGAAEEIGFSLVTQKLPALLKHYGLELQADTDVTQALASLCIRLAMDFVPGFQIRVRRVRGVKRDSDVFSLFEMVMEHKRKASESGKSVSDKAACNAVASKLHWVKPTAYRKFKAIKAAILASRASFEYVNGAWRWNIDESAPGRVEPLRLFSD